MNDYPPPVDRLLHLGMPDEQVEVDPYLELGFGPEHIPDLIRMATDRELLFGEAESPETWGPVHAWRALGMLRAEEAVEPLLDILDLLATADDWAADDLPLVLAMIGPAAIPPLASFLADSWKHPITLHSAILAFKLIVESYPDRREECIEILKGILAHGDSNHPAVTSVILLLLFQWMVVESGANIAEVIANHDFNCTSAGALRHDLGRFKASSRPIVNLYTTGDVCHANPARLAKRKLKELARRKLAKKSRKLNRKR